MSLFADHNGCGTYAGDGCAGCASQSTANELISAIRAIAHGPVSGPTGLEALAMAIAGSDSFSSYNLATAIREGLGEIADAVRSLAN